MGDYAWLAGLGLPAGPYDEPVLLYARFRGRRLHVSADCGRYQQMASWRGAFRVPVALADLDPDRHLCTTCARVLDWHLLHNTGIPGTVERGRYLSWAHQLDTIRVDADHARGEVTDALPGYFPHPRLLADLRELRQRLNKLTADLASDMLGQPLLSAAAATATAVDEVLMLLRDAWNTDEGRLVRLRLAAVTRKPRRFPVRADAPQFPTPDPDTTAKALARPSWALPALEAAYTTWLDTVDAGASVDVVARKTRGAALKVADTRSPGESQESRESGVPVSRAPRPGEMLSEFVADQIRAYADELVDSHLRHWEADMPTRADAVTHMRALARVHVDTDDAVLLLGTRRAHYGAWELLEVPEAVAARAGLRYLSDQAGYGESDEVLRTTLELAVRNGMALPDALEVARGIHATPPAAGHPQRAAAR